jgi:CHASE3 domain sensor protein
MSMSTGAKIAAAFALAIAVVAAIGVNAYISTQRLFDANHWVLRTHEVLECLEDVPSSLTEAESCQREFVLTGQERYLKSYDAAADKVRQDLAALAELVGDNPVQQEGLQQLRRLSDARLADLQEAIKLRKTSGLNAALPAIVTDRGQRIMDDLRAVVAEMEARERELLDERNAVADASADRTIWAVGLWMPLTLLLLTITAVVMMRKVRFGGPVAVSSDRGGRWMGIALPTVLR